MEVSDAKKLRQLEEENRKLKHRRKVFKKAAHGRNSAIHRFGRGVFLDKQIAERLHVFYESREQGSGLGRLDDIWITRICTVR